jgi:hypothetical protein
MNHCSSPVAQTNEVARNQTAKPTNSATLSNDGKKRPAYESKYLLAEELQKIRRSNHSSHHARREVADENDDDHDAFIKGLMYPGLEAPMDDGEFFEEDYDEELLAFNSSMDVTNAAAAAAASVPPVASYPNASNSNPMYSEDSRLQADYYCNLYSSAYYPRPRDDYPDLANEKLRR